MVTFEPAGRLGNWMLEFFCSVAYALRHNLDYTVPHQANRDRFWNPCYAEWLQNSRWNPNLETINLWENGHGYQELPFCEEWRDKNIIIHGYRQSFKYCDDFRDEILYLLNDNWHKREGVVSIHIRRGDYVMLAAKHILYDIGYMLKAVGYFEGLGFTKFKVYSDDIPFCKSEFSKPEFSKYSFEFSNAANEWDDMMDLAKCEHHINSSSTFSLCGAYINRNKDKIVITPEKWFNNDWMGLDTKDIIPSSWLKI